MTVAQRLYLLIFSAALGLIGLGALSFYQIEKIFDSASYGSVNTVPSLVILDDMRKNALRVRLGLNQHVLNTDESKMVEIETTIKGNLQKTEEAIKKYVDVVSDDKDKKMMEEEKELFQRYAAEVPAILSESRQNHNEKARDLLVRNSPLFEKLAGVINDHFDYNVELGSKGISDALTAKKSAVMLSIIITVIILAAVGLMGFLIVRNLMRALGGEPAQAAEVANKIASGDLSSRFEIKAGDTSSLMVAMKTMNETLESVMVDTDKLVKAAAVGDLNTRADANKYQGDFRKLVQGVNDTITNIAEPMKVTSNYIDQIAKGIIPAQITTAYQGEYLVIRNNLNTLVKMMGDLLSETDMLIQGAAAGELDKRANAAQFQGGWNQLVVGVNQIVETVDIAFKDTVRVAEALAKGDLSQKVTRDYRGTFNVVKQSVNGTAESLILIVGEIRAIVAAANRGDFNSKMNLDGKVGFGKELSELLNQLSDTVDIAFKDTIHVASALERGDLTQVVTREYQGAFDQVKQSLNNTVAKLSQVIGEVNAAATNIASASEEVSSTAQSMSQATNEQAASVEETSASVEQMGASINQNSENAKVTDSMAAQAAKQATEGGVAVKETVTAMKQIAGKIGIIDDIAYQTNLLALNAAIEAARAGEHGKGFAVVAAEVRKLAERSQVAAQEIGELAGGSVDKAEEAGKLLDEIVPAINKTSDLVQEITAASEEQSSGATQINTAMNQLNTITQQNASSTEELAATAEEMSGQAEQLQQLMSFFKVSGGAAQTQLHSAAHTTVSKLVTKSAKTGAKLAVSPAHDESEFVKF